MAQKISNSIGMVRDEAREAAMTWADVVERVTGIEPALSAWEADVLPLNYTREGRSECAAGRLARADCHRPDIVPEPARRRRTGGQTHGWLRVASVFGTSEVPPPRVR
jgi:hypothetical protein